jgi:hypothetical protein
MRYSLKSLCAGAALAVATLAAAGSAEASIIPFTDVVSGPVTVTTGSPYSYTHNINDSINIATDTIQGINLTLALQDIGGSEKVYLKFDSGATNLLDTNIPNAGRTYTFNSIVLSLIASLQADGLLQMTLSVLPCTCGQSADVIFASSTLTGYAERTDVPEPAILSLLGAGLAGMGILRRRRAQKGQALAA